MRIIKAHRTKYGHYYIVFDEIPEKTYRKEGCNYVGRVITVVAAEIHDKVK